MATGGSLSYSPNFHPLSAALLFLGDSMKLPSDYLPVDPDPNDGGESLYETEAKLAEATGLPVGHHLIKAMTDPFDYALRMRSGEVVQFESADYIGGGWVRLTLHDYHSDVSCEKIAFPAARGVDIRIFDIIWVMDAPRGS